MGPRIEGGRFGALTPSIYAVRSRCAFTRTDGNLDRIHPSPYPASATSHTASRLQPPRNRFSGDGCNHLKIDHNPKQARAPPAKFSVGCFGVAVRIDGCADSRFPRASLCSPFRVFSHSQTLNQKCLYAKFARPRCPQESLLRRSRSRREPFGIHTVRRFTRPPLMWTTRRNARRVDLEN